MTEKEFEGKTMLMRVPEDKVTKGKGFYWEDLGDPQTILRMVLMACAEPGKAVVRKDDKEAEE